VNLSEIAQFRQRQAAEEASAQLGLGGLAITASHEAILARMEQGARTLFQLFQQGRSEEAYALWEAGMLEQEYNQLGETSMREQHLLHRTQTSVGLVNIAVHGHFYQPPREDPFTGMIPQEPGAAPFRNFNEKITAECYRPNAEAGNFDTMSFNLGPTLARWLEKAHPQVYRRIIEADRFHHNALAQGYNHVILPLASERDKRTQILWGMQDFRHRFGREPRGMWMAEMAVDIETLDMMAQCGIQFTLLAPWQVKGTFDSTEPYLVRLKAGRCITIFIYNDLSGAVSYNDAATADANAFAASYQRSYLNHDKAGACVPQMHVIATDGELYGHHKPFRDRFLSHFLQRSAPAYGMSPCSLERYLQACPATKEMEIHEPSSWSCMHGVDRWSVGCACTPGKSHWKDALRRALTHLAERADALFEQYAGQTLSDPWAARDDALALRNGWEIPERFWMRHGVTERLDVAHIQQAELLLEAEYWLQCSQTSCGFFFEDLDRIEPVNIIAAARRAISLFWLATGYDLQRRFLKDLEQARSWRTERTGGDLYHALPVVPENLLPPQ